MEPDARVESHEISMSKLPRQLYVVVNTAKDRTGTVQSTFGAACAYGIYGLACFSTAAAALEYSKCMPTTGNLIFSESRAEASNLAASMSNGEAIILCDDPSSPRVYRLRQK